MSNSNKDLMAMGQRISERAKLMRLKQNYIAEHVGVSSGVVSTWFSGRGQPRIKNLKLLASLLQTNTPWILTGDTSGEGHTFIKELNAKAIGNRIQEAIWNKKIRRTDLAKELGASPSTVSNWVAGKLIPDVGKTEDLAAVLGVSVEWINTGRDIKKENSVIAKAHADFIAHSNTVIEVEEITELDTSSINNKADISVELQLHKLIGELQKKAYDEGYAQAQADIKQLWDKK